MEEKSKKYSALFLQFSVRGKLKCEPSSFIDELYQIFGDDLEGVDVSFLISQDDPKEKSHV